MCIKHIFVIKIICILFFKKLQQILKIDSFSTLAINHKALDTVLYSEDNFNPIWRKPSALIALNSYNI